MARQHTVFAVIPAELGKKRHRLLGALRDQFAVHPVQRVRESGSLAVHFGRKQVAYREVEGKPVGVEAADEFVPAFGLSKASRNTCSASRSSKPTDADSKLGRAPSADVELLAEWIR